MANKSEKHKYGPFGNMQLTDEEYRKLKERFPDADERIEDADIYLEAKGGKYKSHYAMLLNWDRMDRKRRMGTQGTAARKYDHEY